MIRSVIRSGLLAGAVALGACDLVVNNPNSPGTPQVKTTPADLENFLGTQYRRWSSGLYSTTTNVWGMMNIQSFENYSTLANNCQNARYPVPKVAPSNNNQVGNTCDSEQLTIYSRLSESGRGAADVLRALDGGLTFGSAAEDARNRAFAEFLRGLSLGYLAIVYDSAAIIKADDPLTPANTAEPGELSSYKEVMIEALSALDKSIVAANASAGATGANGFPLPANWMFTVTSMTAPEFIKVVHSYAARLRAQNARNPAERAAVDWDKVIADAQAGITADHKIITSTTTDPRNNWIGQWYAYTTWHQMTPFIFGMADGGTSYATWIAQPLNTRGAGTPFFMQSPDQRLPQGATRAAQQADFALTQCTNANQVCRRFFVNRATSDPATSSSWGGSQYDAARWYSWRTSGSGTAQNGPFPFFLKSELNMLEAEGQYRKGNFAAAAALVNLTRTACGPDAAGVLNTPAGCTARPAGNGSVGDPGGGLPAITAFDAVSPVPGGAACVPKMPVAASNAGGGTVTCGNLFEAIKYEKRIETAFTHFGGWFLDSRGWGDLAETVPVHWAPPFEELQARFRIGAQIYSVGGNNPTGGAAASHYGW
ncbi:MAG TPA: hypothetical protein VFU23_08785 [Gemmatimonadales bacterium]|nr:hypothetical protein [Gemmatimonadales bacterium]